ncbi:RNA polymerase sigma factor [Chitinophaga arvensicola]|uniref:RNA polymerase sigma factor n=1 Tax=Chitinophaga arvensicola TaxID=29529 RepID=A0A1I0RQB1_9BACT|nr:RNA polymerase sigma-70 factor [Chitinophaga arvensicola]SEW43473.1 RNA polymerase sigma-70 factor, ECF subfamily [Chitinophaga arvensicola]
MEENVFNEQALLLSVSAGDEHAFSLLYHHYYQLLRPFVWKLTRSATDTEEIIQETFIRVWLYRDKLPEIINFRAWIFKVTSRENLTYLRKKLPAMATADEDTDTSAQAPVNTPFQSLQAAEVKQLISEAINQFPDQRRKIFRMSRDEGMTAAEIAAALSISVQTVHNTVTTALKQIRDYLEAHGYIIPSLIYLLLHLL